ncbi:MAG TPA: hypothetical protein VFL49_00200 [Pseudolabrys sp.]|nr:hypothetical protein [Pseudolabrys sp.]
MSPRHTARRFLALATAACRSRGIACLAATLFVGATVSHAQPAPGPAASAPAAVPQQIPAPTDPQTLSCNDLKARLHTTGQLPILVGPRGGWADTFYGPQVPRCQFWQMPWFQYVRTNDGLCGVGYICIDKLSFD